MKKRGRPTLKESEENPNSVCNIQRDLILAGYKRTDLLSKTLQDIELIDDPVERVKARQKFFEMTAPYTDRKLGSEEKHDHTLTITVNPMFLPQNEKNITPIEVSSS